jgi:hypothetical protein
VTVDGEVVAPVAVVVAVNKDVRGVAPTDDSAAAAAVFDVPVALRATEDCGVGLAVAVVIAGNGSVASLSPTDDGDCRNAAAVSDIPVAV